MQGCNKRGSLKYFTGAMACGKSTHLLQKAFNYKSHGFDVITLVSSLDDRFGTGKITSRIGISSEARIIRQNDKEIFEQIKEEVRKSSKFGAIMVDECQFLDSDAIDALSDIVDELGIDVLCYGIKTDFNTNVFTGSLRLLEISDEIVELPSICECGANAIMNARLVNSTEKVFIGAEESYKSMCRVCYKKFIKNKEDK